MPTINQKSPQAQLQGPAAPVHSLINLSHPILSAQILPHSLSPQLGHSLQENKCQPHQRSLEFWRALPMKDKHKWIKRDLFVSTDVAASLPDLEPSTKRMRQASLPAPPWLTLHSASQ